MIEEIEAVCVDRHDINLAQTTGLMNVSYNSYKRLKTVSTNQLDDEYLTAVFS